MQILETDRSYNRESVCEMEISLLVKENAVAKAPLPSPGRTD